MDSAALDPVKEAGLHMIVSKSHDGAETMEETVGVGQAPAEEAV